MCFVEMFFCQQDSFAKEVGLDLSEAGGVDVLIEVLVQEQTLLWVQK